MKPKMKECDCCEKPFELAQLIPDGGLRVCYKCKVYMDITYPKLMAEEANEGKDK
jgi:hypothetical protein